MGKTNTNDLSVQEKALAMSIIFFSKLILTLLLVFKGILNLVLLIAWKLINTEVRTVDFFVLLMQTRKRTSDISWQVLTQKFSQTWKTCEKRNNSRLNRNEQIQLQVWRENCGI